MLFEIIKRILQNTEIKFLHRLFSNIKTYLLITYLHCKETCFYHNKYKNKGIVAISMDVNVYINVQIVLVLTCAPVDDVLRFLKVNFLCSRSSAAQPESAPVSEPRSSSEAREMCLKIHSLIIKWCCDAR